MIEENERDMITHEGETEGREEAGNLRSSITYEAGFVLVADQILRITQEICSSCDALINERLHVTQRIMK